MEITYIGHSGFSVELEKCVLLFDYYEGAIPDFPTEKHIYVCSSHFHHDHFNMEIMKLAEIYPSITYILSYDIGKRFRKKFFLRHGVSEELYQSIHFVNEGITEAIGDLNVQTFHSTDEGVAFLIHVEGKRIYHAGDLQWWTWEGETKEEYTEMTNAFQGEIAKLPKEPLDVAFLVLDPRQEDKFWMGFDYFMRHVEVKKAYPMHFWKDASVIDKLLALKCSENYREKIVPRTFYEKRRTL